MRLHRFRGSHPPAMTTEEERQKGEMYRVVVANHQKKNGTGDDQLMHSLRVQIM